MLIITETIETCPFSLDMTTLTMVKIKDKIRNRNVYNCDRMNLDS